MEYKLNNDISIDNKYHFTNGILNLELNRKGLLGLDKGTVIKHVESIIYTTIQVRHGIWYLEISSDNNKYYVAIYTNRVNCIKDYMDISKMSSATNELLDGMLGFIENSEDKINLNNIRVVPSIDTLTGPDVSLRSELINLLYVLNNKSTNKINKELKNSLIKTRNTINEYLGSQM